MSAVTALAERLLLAWIVHSNDRLARRRTGTRTMDPKLTMFFMLFGSIIALSNLRVEHLARLKDGLSLRRWRKTNPIQS
jgi:hypothetical protein